MSIKRLNLRFLVPAFLAALLLTTVGCGGSKQDVKPPTDKIANVELAVARARDADAPEHAPLELKLAEDNLVEAKAALGQEKYLEAERAAEKALVDAMLAETKSRSALAKDKAKELRESIEVLRNEIQRARQKF